MLRSRCPLGENGTPTTLKDCPAQRRRVPVPIGMCLPSLNLVVCIDRMARHCTVDLQRGRTVVTPAQVNTTLAGWEEHWVSRTGSMPTAMARRFLADLQQLEDTLQAIGL